MGMNRTTIVGALLAGLVMAGASAPMAWAQDGPGKKPEGQVGFKSELTLDVKDQPLTSVVDYIKTLTGKNVLLGKNPEGKNLKDVWPPLTVTVQFEEVPWEQALRLVAESAGCLVEREGEVWTIYQPPVVTIEMERADLRDVVQAIAAVSGANVLVGSDVPDDLPVSVRLRNIPWFHALGAVVKSVGMTLVEEQQADIWIIRDPQQLKKVLETRVIKLRYIRPSEGYSAKIINDKVDAPTANKATTKKRIDEFTLLKAVEKGMTKQNDGGALLGGVDYDIITNSLILSDVATKLDEIQAIIERLDVEPLQVQVDVKFVSTTITDFLDVGINFANGLRVTGNLGSMTHRLPFDLGKGGFEDDIGLSTDSNGTAFEKGPTAEDVATFNSNNPPYNFGVLDFRQLEFATQFLKTDGKSTITQRPSITVLDNFAATIFVGETVRYAETTLTASQAGGLEGAIEEAENSPVSTGFQLLVVPHVVPDSRKILLTLVPTLDTLTGRSASNPGFDTFTVGDDTIDLPRLSSSTVVTQMMLEDGETAVLGGLIKEVETETVNKLPLLGDIPLLGYLFKNVTTQRERQNIVLFVTVRIVRNKRDATEALEAQLKARQKDLRAQYYEQVKRTEFVPLPEEGEGEGEGDGAGEGEDAGKGSGEMGGNYFEGRAGSAIPKGTKLESQPRKASAKSRSASNSRGWDRSWRRR
jgi:type II secretory pathway component GspD/PulD (secretin)